MGSSNTDTRDISYEERRMLDSQRKSIEQMTKLAEKSDKISDEDRQYFKDVFQGRISGVDVDMELVKKIASSDTDMQNALGKWSSDTATLNKDYGSKIEGLSDDYIKGIEESGTSYRDNLQAESDKIKTLSEETQANMGRADEDIYSRVKGQNLAGISTATQDAQKNVMSSLASRGLAGSGVEANALTQVGIQGSNLQAGALSQSYGQAIGMSDNRRLQNLNTQLNSSASVGQMQQGIYGSSMNDLGAIANSGINVAGTQYGMNSQFNSQQLSNQGMANQQNLANLQMGSGVGRGIYQGASNYSGQALSGYGQAGSQAGQQGQYLGQAQMQFNAQQDAADAAIYQGIGSMVGLGVGAYAGS